MCPLVGIKGFHLKVGMIDQGVGVVRLIAVLVLVGVGIAVDKFARVLVLAVSLPFSPHYSVCRLPD